LKEIKTTLPPPEVPEGDTGAVQGLIAGETSIPLAEINMVLKEAMIETNGILSEYSSRIVANTAGTPPGVIVPPDGWDRLKEALRAAFDLYFRPHPDELTQFGHTCDQFKERPHARLDSDDDGDPD